MKSAPPRFLGRFTKPGHKPFNFGIYTPSASAEQVCEQLLSVKLTNIASEFSIATSPVFPSPPNYHDCNAALRSKEAFMKPLQEILSLILKTLNEPTFIEPEASCRNLTRTLQEIEKICLEALSDTYNLYLPQ